MDYEYKSWLQNEDYKKRLLSFCAWRSVFLLVAGRAKIWRPAADRKSKYLFKKEANSDVIKASDGQLKSEYFII